jgi:hypothetical protein
MTSYEPNVWTTIATFCRELAPISGALLDSIGQTAAAIDRAGFESRSLRAPVNRNRQPVLTPENENDEELV